MFTGVIIKFKNLEVFLKLNITGYFKRQAEAGKTTSTLMLFGAYKPTSGTAVVLGHDISEIDSVRAFIGYCPEKNILFDNLTVEEHLEFMSSVISLFV